MRNRERKHHSLSVTHGLFAFVCNKTYQEHLLMIIFSYLCRAEKTINQSIRCD